MNELTDDEYNRLSCYCYRCCARCFLAPRVWSRANPKNETLGLSVTCACLTETKRWEQCHKASTAGAMAANSEAGRWAQLEAREKEMKLQLREAARIKAGWDKMQQDLSLTKEQLNKLNQEHLTTVTICRELKKKNTAQQARIAELERLLKQLQGKDDGLESAKVLSEELASLRAQQLQWQKAELRYQDQILKHIADHKSTAMSLSTSQAELKRLILSQRSQAVSLAGVVARAEAAEQKFAGAATREQLLSSENVSLKKALEDLHDQLGQQASNADASKAVCEESSNTVKAAQQPLSASDGNAKQASALDDPESAALLAKQLLQSRQELSKMAEQLVEARLRLANCACAGRTAPGFATASTQTEETANSTNRSDASSDMTSKPGQDAPTSASRAAQDETAAQITALKTKLAKVMLSAEEHQRRADLLRQEAEAEVERRQALLRELSTEKVNAASKAAALRDRDDEIARLKLAALKHADELRKATTHRAEEEEPSVSTSHPPTQASHKHTDDSSTESPRRHGRKKKKGLAAINAELVTEIEMLKMMVDGAKKEVARRDKLIKRLKRGS